MEVNKKRRYSSDGRRKESTTADHQAKEADEVVPGITIVRSSTPRPLTLGPMLAALSSSGTLPAQGLEEDGTPLPDFPSSAPSAPPVPEELSDIDEEVLADEAVPISQLGTASVEESQEFDWLFEYGLEMDSSVLNSPERLDGAALLYGPAVLKGYRILFGSVEKPGEKEGRRRTIATIGSGPDDAEIWGVLYRIPRRVRDRAGAEPALLDALHDAAPPGSLFRPVQAVVRETYRNRDIECVTYVATDAVQQRMKPYVSGQSSIDMLYVQRVTTLARKLGLPENYLSAYTQLTDRAAERNTERIPAATPMAAPMKSPIRTPVKTVVQTEKNTEPLPAFGNIGEIDKTPFMQVEKAEGAVELVQREVTPSNPWLVVFAVYLVAELVIVLTFAVMQGMGFGNTVLTHDFTLLGVPWLVLMYGLLGGCMSSIISLGRLRATYPPVFIIITWFTRPYIGAALALLSYLLLTSGFFIFDRSGGKHDAFFLLIGALAGLCESQIFQRQGNR